MLNILRQIQGWVKLKGDTDGTKIGNINDRLKVDAVFNPVPSIDVTYFVKDYEHSGGSNDMVLNGSTTPVVFDVKPPAGKTYYITETQIYISDGGNPQELDFGQIAGGITNGLFVEVKVNGSQNTLYNLKNNIDLSVGFRVSPERSQFLTDKNFVGFRVFEPALRLVGDNGDFLQVTVRDDLTNLKSLRMSTFGFEVM